MVALYHGLEPYPCFIDGDFIVSPNPKKRTGLMGLECLGYFILITNLKITSRLRRVIVVVFLIDIVFSLLAIT